jgi:hypothetical protein
MVLFGIIIPYTVDSFSAESILIRHTPPLGSNDYIMKKESRLNFFRGA